ncbi:MAG: exodeoxyribonuclease VII small subunit [Phycisphaerales bacterium JB059]
MPKDPAPEPNVSELSYEQAVERLEELVERIESGEIGLEASIAAYERGVALLARCRTVLDDVEQRIEQLSVEEIEQERGRGGDRADEGA